MTQPVREAALRPAAAEFYPFLPARMWTAAGHLTELVARYRGIRADARDRTSRVLSEAHFRFRGGELGGAGEARAGYGRKPSSPRCLPNPREGVAKTIGSDCVTDDRDQVGPAAYHSWGCG